MVFKAAAEPSEPSEPKAIVSHLELNEDWKILHQIQYFKWILWAFYSMQIQLCKKLVDDAYEYNVPISRFFPIFLWQTMANFRFLWVNISWYLYCNIFSAFLAGKFQWHFGWNGDVWHQKWYKAQKTVTFTWKRVKIWPLDILHRGQSKSLKKSPINLDIWTRSHDSNKTRVPKIFFHLPLFMDFYFNTFSQVLTFTSMLA